MEFTVEQSPHKAEIFLTSNMNAEAEAAQVHNTIVDLIKTDNKTIVINLSDLSFIQSWEIGILTYAFSTCKKEGVDFYISGVNKRILNTLQKIKIDQIIQIEEK